MVDYNKVRLNEITEILKNLNIFSEQLNEYYAQSISVTYGKAQIKKILNHLDNESGTINSRLLNEEIKSLIRGYENIFKEIELALEFNSLVDQLYMSSQYKE